jgi:hypothetical protein
LRRCGSSCQPYIFKRALAALFRIGHCVLLYLPSLRPVSEVQKPESEIWDVRHSPQGEQIGNADDAGFAGWAWMEYPLWVISGHRRAHQGWPLYLSIAAAASLLKESALCHKRTLVVGLCSQLGTTSNRDQSIVIEVDGMARIIQNSR